MKKTLKFLLAGTLVAASTALTAPAQTVVSYTVVDSDDGASVAPTVTDSTTTTATDYTVGSGFVGDGNLGYGVSPTVANGDFSSTLSGAESANDYYTFSVAPTAGNALTLTSLDFTGARLYNGAGGTLDVTLESNVTGYGTSDGTFAIGTAFPEFGADILLPAAFSNLTSSVTFRLYVYGTSGGGEVSLPYDAVAENSPGGHGDDPTGEPIRLNGTVSAATTTPEPATYALMGLGLAVLAVTLRNRRALRS